MHIQCATACSLKFKLLYLSNYISYFNKICSICSVNTHMQSLKVWLKSALSRLKYIIFSRGLFFYWRTLYITVCMGMTTHANVGGAA